MKKENFEEATRLMKVLKEQQEMLARLDSQNIDNPVVLIKDTHGTYLTIGVNSPEHPYAHLAKGFIKSMIIRIQLDIEKIETKLEEL